MRRRVPYEHPQPATRVQFRRGASKRLTRLFCEQQRSSTSTSTNAEREARTALRVRGRPHSIPDHLLCTAELRKTRFGRSFRADYLPSDQIGFCCQDAITY